MAKRGPDEPCMSDRTLLLSVEDLVSLAMGSSQKNTVNFKIIQTVLHILARQMRILETKVEIRISDERIGTDDSSISSTDEKQRAKQGKSPKGKRDESARTGKEDIILSRERDTTKDKEKAARIEQKEREKIEKMSPQEREQYEKEKEAKEIVKQEKEKEKAAKLEQKEKELLEKMSPKEREQYEKVKKEKTEKAAAKQKEKEKDIIAKMDHKEKEKFEKMSPKEKERYIKQKVGKSDKKASQLEDETDESEEEYESFERKSKKTQSSVEGRAGKHERGAEKDDKYGDEKSEKERKKGRASSVTGISVKEQERGKEKVLVVEKGPTTRPDHTRGSIDVVTQSEFALLEAAVKELEKKAGPLPPLAMPDNVKLKADLTKGSASLTDTMQAMQVDARVKAAEQTIGRLADLLTQLAAAGAIPSDVVATVTTSMREKPHDKVDFSEQVSMPAKSHKSVAIDPMSLASALSKPDSSIQPSVSQFESRQSIAAGLGRPSSVMQPKSTVSMGRPSVAGSMSVTSRMPRVTRKELDDALESVKENLSKNVNTWTNKAIVTAEMAFNTAKAVSEKLDVALKLDKRISMLCSQVAEHADILQGFESGLSLQMQGFQEQMAQMQSELQQGLKQLEQVNNNAETAAVLELTEQYQGLVAELDRTLLDHQTRSLLHWQLGDELKNLVEAMEILREQKADRDEVMDGLRDKADLSRLAGLLSEGDFAVIREQLEQRLEMCYNKFYKQEQVWVAALKELSQITEEKAELVHLLSIREEMQNHLRDIHELLRKLEEMLGEPKTAVLIRKLARDATCGACMTPALMDLTDSSYGKPPSLPASRPAHPAPPPDVEPDDLCLFTQKNLRDFANLNDALARHMCLRWCGGSHTLMTGSVHRERATGIANLTPRKQYTGYGADGRPYMMDEELQPCAECNMLSYEDAETKPEENDASQPEPKPDGAGDHGDSHQLKQPALAISDK